MNNKELFVMVVDDEPSVRGMLVSRLGQDGYSVFDADSGEGL